MLVPCLFASLALCPASAKTNTLSLENLEQTLLRNEHLCRAASIGISTSFGGQGSGVIISRDGIIMTAAHVIDRAGTEFTAILADGQRVKGVALLVNDSTDSALAKIITKAPKGGWKYRPIRTKQDLGHGDWCTVIAHSGGIQANRPAPFRLGRVIANTKTKSKNVLVSDCTVVSGDSGGPLFDLDGHVSGINSTVEPNSVLNNLHLSSHTFIAQWGDYLLNGKKLPTAAEAKKADLMARKKAGKSLSRIPDALIPIMRSTLQKKWPELNDEALKCLLDAATYKNGNLAIKPNLETLKKFEELGYDPVKYGLSVAKKTTEKPKEKKTVKRKSTSRKQSEKALRSAYTREYGKISEEAMLLLLSVSVCDPETGENSIVLDANTLKKLREMGVKINSGKNYDAAARQNGDSAEDVTRYFPALANAIEVHQNGQRLGLATAVKKDGFLVCKASMLKGEDNVEIFLNRVSTDAKVLARDESSDLALLKIPAKLSVVEWSKKSTIVGRLLAVVTQEHPMLATVSVLPRIIPDAKSGQSSKDVTHTAAQSLSAMAGDLSKRRVTFPECFSHDAIMWADDCGGPVYTIDGKLIGINIARFSRTTNYALTEKSVKSALKRLFKNKR